MNEGKDINEVKDVNEEKDMNKEEKKDKFKNSIDEDIEVVLMHDYSRYTIQILPEAIDYLRENNYILLPLFYESVKVNK